MNNEPEKQVEIRVIGPQNFFEEMQSLAYDDPEEAEKRTSDFWARLDRLPVKELLARAPEVIRARHQTHLWHIYPSACLGLSDLRDADPSVSAYWDYKRKLGEKVLQAAGLNEMDGPCFDIAEALIKDAHRELLRELETDYEQWEAGDWEAIHKRGGMSAEDCADFTAEFPSGNPQVSHGMFSDPDYDRQKYFDRKAADERLEEAIRKGSAEGNMSPEDAEFMSELESM